MPVELEASPGNGQKMTEACFHTVERVPRRPNLPEDRYCPAVVVVVSAPVVVVVVCMPSR